LNDGQADNEYELDFAINCVADEAASEVANFVVFEIIALAVGTEEARIATPRSIFTSRSCDLLNDRTSQHVERSHVNGCAADREL